MLSLRKKCPYGIFSDFRIPSAGWFCCTLSLASFGSLAPRPPTPAHCHYYLSVVFVYKIQIAHITIRTMVHVYSKIWFYCIATNIHPPWLALHHKEQTHPRQTGIPWSIHPRILQFMQSLSQIPTKSSNTCYIINYSISSHLLERPHYPRD
jgi:hypothetical protein